MSRLLHLREILDAHAQLQPDKAAAQDSSRALTFQQWNARARRLANALLGLGLQKGDRVAALAYNCAEWLEIYVAVAKAGLIAVPVNFRLLGPEIRYIVDDAGATALIVQEDLRARTEEIRSEPSPHVRYIQFGAASPPAGYQSYEGLIAAAAHRPPPVHVESTDPTTGAFNLSLALGSSGPGVNYPVYVDPDVATGYAYVGEGPNITSVLIAITTPAVSRGSSSSATSGDSRRTRT